MSGRKKTSPKKAHHPAYKFMIFEAITSQRTAGKGSTRAVIAKYIQTTYKLEAGSAFDSALRRALAAGMKSGVLTQGETAQRYKLTDSGRAERKNANKPKPKKRRKIKKVSESDKDTNDGYESEEYLAEIKVTKKKKKITKKKKKNTVKKKAAPKKKKAASKKKKMSKKENDKMELDDDGSESEELGEEEQWVIDNIYDYRSKFYL